MIKWTGTAFQTLNSKVSSSQWARWTRCKINMTPNNFRSRKRLTKALTTIIIIPGAKSLLTITKMSVKIINIMMVNLRIITMLTSKAQRNSRCLLLSTTKKSIKVKSCMECQKLINKTTTGLSNPKKLMKESPTCLSRSSLTKAGQRSWTRKKELTLWAKLGWIRGVSHPSKVIQTN